MSWLTSSIKFLISSISTTNKRDFRMTQIYINIKRGNQYEKRRKFSDKIMINTYRTTVIFNLNKSGNQNCHNCANMLRQVGFSSPGNSLRPMVENCFYFVVFLKPLYCVISHLI